MLRLGVAGTGWIADDFIEAARRTGFFALAAVFSRTIERAMEFGAKYGTPALFDDFHRFVNADVDAIYIATPNAIHCEQVMAAIEAGKHAIVEKPAFSNAREAVRCFAMARDRGVFLLEAVRHIHEANFALLRAQLSGIGELRGAHMTYMKYSSRYDAVLRGEEPNVFSPAYSGGALMDLGIYLIYAAVALFGKPRDCAYHCRKVRTGVDGMGVILLRYQGYDVALQCGKTADSFLPSEIYGGMKTISMTSMNAIDSIRVFERATGHWEEMARPRRENRMEEEAEAFGRLMANSAQEEAKRAYERLEWLSLTVHEIMTKLRADNAIVFAADCP